MCEGVDKGISGLPRSRNWTGSRCQLSHSTLSIGRSRSKRQPGRARRANGGLPSRHDPRNRQRQRSQARHLVWKGSPPPHLFCLDACALAALLKWQACDVRYELLLGRGCALCHPAGGPLRLRLLCLQLRLLRLRGCGLQHGLLRLLHLLLLGGLLRLLRVEGVHGTEPVGACTYLSERSTRHLQQYCVSAPTVCVVLHCAKEACVCVCMAAAGTVAWVPTLAESEPCSSCWMCAAGVCACACMCACVQTQPRMPVCQCMETRPCTHASKTRTRECPYNCADTPTRAALPASATRA